MSGKTPPKSKKSFTLSRSSVVFLERLRRERKVLSASRVLDDLIQQEEARHRRRTVEDAIADYYSNLSDAERGEEKAWGQFALEQLTAVQIATGCAS